MGIPTHVLNDGYKGDDFSPEGMTADVALSWSRSIASRYYGRRPERRTVVTGNPRADRSPTPATDDAAERRGVLVGTFTFSAVDINCRRSDPESFLEAVLTAIATSSWAAGEPVTIKLHPADNPGHYQQIFDRFEDLDMRVMTTGDVTGLFARHRMYITTYSTSLLEAARAGLPIAYFRANEQEIHAPFSDDPILASRTADTPERLTELIDTAAAPSATGTAPNIEDWVEQYLGPADGRSVERIIAAIEETLSDRR